jgi:hypothetical protein
MPAKKYIVDLTQEEREFLEKLTTTGKSPAYKINHARILLKADISQKGGGWIDGDISDALDISRATIERVRQRFVEQGWEEALNRQTPSRYKPRCLDGEQEAHLLALVCGAPPSGQGRWSLRLLADSMVELGYIESISYVVVPNK